jgi:4-amino-4-deoxychorismate lyase
LHARGGIPLNWKHHFLRLRADCDLLALVLPEERDLLAEVARVAPEEATVKIIVTRGAGGRGYAPVRHPPTRVVAAFAPPNFPESLRREGVRVRRCALVLSEQPRTAGAKTLNRLENVLARGEWTDAEVREGLLGDAAGRVIEGTMSNVFLVKDGRAATPALSRCGVVGAQRERVRELLAAEGIECTERDIAFEEVVAADEVFLTGSLIGAWPVSAFGERSWTPGPVTRRVQRLIEQDDAQAH